MSGNSQNNDQGEFIPSRSEGRCQAAPPRGTTSSSMVSDAATAHPEERSPPRMHGMLGGMHFPSREPAAGGLALDAHQEDIEEFPSPPKTPRDLRGRMDASWVVPDMPVPDRYPVVCMRG